MTYAELEEQVIKNTAAIQSLANSLSIYAKQTDLNSTNSSVSANTTDISNLQTAIAEIKNSIGLINKFSKLLDVNIVDITKDDILQWDGDRWTNISPSSIVTSTSQSLRVEDLSNVQISSKSDGQALCWSNSANKWVNATVSTGGGGTTGGGMSIDDMWGALTTYDGTHSFHPSYVKGNLNISGLTVNGVVLTTGSITSNSNILAKGEVTAYS